MVCPNIFQGSQSTRAIPCSTLPFLKVRVRLRIKDMTSPHVCRKACLTNALEHCTLANTSTSRGEKSKGEAPQLQFTSS